MSTYVPSFGPHEARIFAIGEAPGADEERLGAPFVGAAGYELDNLFADANILRSEVFIANVCRFRPPANDISHFIKPAPKSASKMAALVSQGFQLFRNRMVKPFVIEHVLQLEQEILAVKPNVLILFGNTPLWVLYGQEGIMKWKGSILEVDVRGQTFKAIPVPHPANLLRNPEGRADTVHYLQRVRVHSTFPETQEPNWQFQVRPSFRETMETLEFLWHRQGILAADIETRSQQIACYGLAWSATESLCVPLMCLEKREGYFSCEEETAVWRRLLQVLDRSQLIGQNFLYDAYYTALWTGQLLRPWFDTLIAQNVIFPGTKKDLGYLASLYCNWFRYWKDEGREWNPRKTAEDQLWKYNCQDCCYDFELAQTQDRVIDGRDLRPQFNRQMSLFTPTLRTMMRGTRTSTVQREKAVMALHQAMLERTRRLQTIFGHEVNPRTDVRGQLGKLFNQDLQCKGLRIPIIKDRSTGRPTLNDAALEQIAQAEPILATPIKLITEARTIGVLKSTFADPDGPSNRFYYSYNPAGTETYRYSGSKNPLGWGTNPQNIPKFEEDDQNPAGVDIRKAFIPDPGMLLVEADLSKADLHVVAWEADEPELKDMLARQVNVYREGAKVVAMPYTKAKSFIHGTDYGGSARTLAITQKITVAQSKAAQLTWFGKYPGIKRWHRRTEAQLKSTCQVSNMFGYKRFYFGRVEACLPEALAWTPQSTVAIVINIGFLRITSTFPEIEVLLQTHDSLTFQVPITQASWLVPAAIDLMQVTVPYPQPLVIPIDAKASFESWGDLHSWDTIKGQL